MIYPGERVDSIGFGNLKLIQKPEDFCYGVDAVILADFASKRKSRLTLDLGTGTGIIPHILSHKTNTAHIYGIEYQQDSFQRAVRNAKLNHLEHRIQFICANVADFEDMKDLADVVTANPPYMLESGGISNTNEAKAIARHEIAGTLEDFIKCAATSLKSKGSFYLVHRPSRLVDIFYNCRKYKIEPKEMRLVYPKVGEKANIVLIHCVKNGGRELNMLTPLHIYDKLGNYTRQIEEIYERTT